MVDLSLQLDYIAFDNTQVISQYLRERRQLTPVDTIVVRPQLGTQERLRAVSKHFLDIHDDC
jgi:hypothetical protein